MSTLHTEVDAGRLYAFEALLAAWPEATAWTPAAPMALFDESGTITVGTWGGYWLQIARMAYNERVLLAPTMHPTGLFGGDGSWDHGWCYPIGGAAMLALLSWDPQLQAEPTGYERRIIPALRPVGQTAPGWQPEQPGGSDSVQ